MNFLFWNLKQKNLSASVRTLADEHASDFVVLAEAADHAADCLKTLNDGRSKRLYRLVRPLVSSYSQLVIFSRLPQNETVPAGSDGRCDAVRVQAAGLPEFLLACVHLPSQRHYTADDRAALARETADFVCSMEKKAGHPRTLVMGDFNMNPFEPGMVAWNGFHAVVNRHIASKEGRSIQGKSRPFFYNPSWRFMHDEGRNHSGTFYYSKSVPVCHFWNTFDQVLLRSSLLPFFQDSGFKLITHMNDKSLLDAEGRPHKMFSDHLPIHLNLSL